MTGHKIERRLSLKTRQELQQVIAERYRSATRQEKQQILDEFTQVTGFHRKHAIRALQGTSREAGEPAPRSRLYDEATRQALILLWEAADRICGKRLKPIVPTLLDAMERHGHLALDTVVRQRLIVMSAATMDRLLQPVREVARQGRRRTALNTTMRKSIAVRTFGDWNNPPPGYFEMDLVAHCGRSVAGSHAHSLVLTDVATGWTEAAALIVREQTLIAFTLDEIRAQLPFPMLGLDVDNDSAFINETLVNFCRNRQIELTRCRAYHKNDQAWIEQKNGAVIRKMVGYGRLEGVTDTTALGYLHQQARWYVNFFQPSFKLQSKTRQGAKVTKKYHQPATPYKRLLAHTQVGEICKEKLRRIFSTLDPVQLLQQIRRAQHRLAQQETDVAVRKIAESQPDLKRFLGSLSTAWQDGEIRPTHRKRFQGPRHWRTRIDPFAQVWPLVEHWLQKQPEVTAKELFARLQSQGAHACAPGQLRTLQRRVKEWRTAVARQLVLGAGLEFRAEDEPSIQPEEPIRTF